MTWQSISFLGRRMARRNHLYLFAWLCALVLPVALQVLAGANDDVRDYLTGYFGEISLFMFFVMTYGFGTVFVSYYLVGSYRLPGTLDCLRVSGISAWSVVLGVFLELQLILIPPVLVFGAGFVVYALLGGSRAFGGLATWPMVAGMALVIIVNQAILAAIPLTALFRREALVALVAAVVVLPVNALPVILVFIHKWPAWAYFLMLLAVLLALLTLAVFNLSQLWPAQRRPLTDK